MKAKHTGASIVSWCFWTICIATYFAFRILFLFMRRSWTEPMVRGKLLHRSRSRWRGLIVNNPTGGPFSPILSGFQVWGWFKERWNSELCRVIGTEVCFKLPTIAKLTEMKGILRSTIFINKCFFRTRFSSACRHAQNSKTDPKCRWRCRNSSGLQVFFSWK